MVKVLKYIGFILIFLLIKELTYELNLNENASFFGVNTAFNLQIFIFVYTIILSILFYTLQYLFKDLKPLYLSYLYSFLIVVFCHVITFYGAGYVFVSETKIITINTCFTVFGFALFLMIILTGLVYEIIKRNFVTNLY